ncbi:MAG: hypothetical protein ACFE8E_05710 [Candidatus Hodarchaeota archaeon]
MKKIKKLLFVCAGNTARSPAAEYLAKFYAQKHNLDIYIDSCGFFNAFSYMQPESQEYLNSKAINHSDFRPKIINKNLLEEQDLILTMEHSQLIEIITDYSNVKDIEKKTFTLKQFNGNSTDLDIIDPYYTSSATYAKILKIIDINIEKLIQKIIELNR